MTNFRTVRISPLSIEGSLQPSLSKISGHSNRTNIPHYFDIEAER